MEEYTRWDDFLIAEHELIERAMAVLRECLEKVDEGGHDPVKLQRSIDFLLEFGDKIHNTKEERFLFPLMGQHGIPTMGGPIGVMLMEHEAERKLLVNLSSRAASLDAEPMEERMNFRQEAEDYLKIRAEHIWKENDVLYPMARRVFPESANGELLAAFNDLNQQTYGPEAPRKFQRMVEEAEKGGKGKKLIEGLSYEQLDAIMEALPFEVTFVDAEDTVAYFNRLDKEKLFPRSRSVIGRKVDKCHPEKSVDMVQRIVEGFKDRTMAKAEFWIDFRGDKILIRYFPVYNDLDQYMGVLEVTQAIGAIQKLTGQKRLLD